MATHTAEPTIAALWDESLEARHTAGYLYAARRPDLAIKAEIEADTLLAEARDLAKRIGLRFLVRKVVRGRLPRYRSDSMASGDFESAFATI